MGLFGNRCECQPKLEALEAKLRSLATEFEELHDKTYRWMQRTNKRVRDDAPEQVELVAMSRGDRANQRILERRLRRYGGRNGAEVGEAS